MTAHTLFMAGIISFLIGCNDRSKNTVTESFQVEGDSITTKSTVSDNPLEANYQLADLTPELQNYIAENLKHADSLILKYNGHSTASKYDANVLDEVFEKWRQSSARGKETPEFFTEAIAAALGQDIVNSLDCEWQILTDQYGSDLTVIHKRYKINGFPFSTTEKAFTENKVGSFQTTKLLLKHEIDKAKSGGQVQERR
jgi:hypothetical protein